MAEPITNVGLDLDALAPKAVTIRFKENMIEVNPPTLEQYIQLTELSGKLKGFDSNVDPKTMGPVYVELQDFVRKLIPQLKDANLNVIQITSLFKLLGEMATPNDDAAVAELKKRGITLKQPSDTESLPKDLAS